MHFHLPKPLHGWREFAGEVGVIVLGVLIALSAEQLVERIRERSAAKLARDSIRAEISANLTGLAMRKQNEPCLSRRLDEVALALATAPPRGSGPIWVGHPYYAVLHDVQLRSSEQAGNATLLSPNEQARYAEMYSDFALYMAAQSDEIRAWANLRVLEQRPQLDSVAHWQLRSALQQARTARWLMQASARQAAEAAAKLEIRAAGVPKWPQQSACIGFHTPRQTALGEVAVGRPGGDVYDEP
jgi:hypothetical protein